MLVSVTVFTKGGHELEAEEMERADIELSMQTGTLRIKHPFDLKLEYWIPVSSIDHLVVTRS